MEEHKNMAEEEGTESEFVFYIAGVKHHQYNSVRDLVLEGDTLDLTQERDNRYDPNAVQIKYNTVMLGYVPARLSRRISALLDAGTELECEVINIYPENPPYQQLKVRVFVK